MNILPILKALCKNQMPVAEVAAPKDVNYNIFLLRNYGIFTYQLQRKLNDKHHTISLGKIRYHLKKLEKEGKVISQPNKNGRTRWWVK